MRKIKTMAEVERVRRRNNIILGTAMVLLMIVSTAGYSLMSSGGKDKSNAVSENGFNFQRNNGLWKVAIGEEVFAFQYLPSEVANISVDLSSIGLATYSNQPLYFVNPGEGMSDILMNLNKYILRYQKSCFINDSECLGDLPVKDCNSNLIVFYEGDDKVYSDDSCVFVVGDQRRGADAFLYKLLGVI